MENPLLIVLSGEEKEVYACSNCKRLYYRNGKPVVDKKGAQARLVTENTGAYFFNVW